MYKTIEGHSHILYPSAYRTVEKWVRPCAKVHSATQQFTIQTIASQFVSPRLYVPKPISIIDFRTYSMELIEDLRPIPPKIISQCTALLMEVIRFQNFMISHNYFACLFHLFLDADSRVVILDFSRTGVFSSNPNCHDSAHESILVRFPRQKRLYTFEEAFQDFSFHRSIIIETPCVGSTEENTGAQEKPEKPEKEEVLSA